MWWWDERDHTLHNYGHGDTDAVLFEGFNKNMVLYRNLGRDSQKFTFNSNTHMLRNDHTKRAMTIEWAALKDGANVVTKEVDDNNEQSALNWDFEYCNNSPVSTSEGHGHDGHGHDGK